MFVAKVEPLCYTDIERRQLLWSQTLYHPSGLKIFIFHLELRDYVRLTKSNKLRRRREKLQGKKIDVVVQHYMKAKRK
jgi:endonuclease/exonuclease/phosphatase family metal-dependent hydrolase